MKKFSFMPYLDLAVVSYYVFTSIMMALFFCQIPISDKICGQIHTKEIELQYALDSENYDIASKIQDNIDCLQAENKIYTMNKVKYLFITSILIALVIIDYKVYNKFKDKKCWYTAFHENSCCLFSAQD